MGAEAVELSARAGLHLDQWQQDGLELMLSVRGDGQWACYQYIELCSRQNGKTAGLFAPRALAGLLLFDEQLIMWSAHQYRTVMRSFRQVKSMLKRLGQQVGNNENLIDLGDGIVIKVNNTNGEESFERLDTEQMIQFLARSKSAGRGYSGDANLIDEAFAYTEEMQEALEPTMLAMPNPQLCLASSPPLDGMTGQPLFEARDRAVSGESRSIGYRDWGAEGDLDRLDDVDLEDRSLWSATNPALGTRLTEEKLLHLRESLSDRGFARECLGLWPKRVHAAGGVIDPKQWQRLADPESAIDGVPAFALDATPNQSMGAIAAAGARADGLLTAELLEHQAGIGWMVPWLTEPQEHLGGRSRHAAWGPCAVVLDPTSSAGALIPALREAGIEPVLLSGREMAQATGAFYDLCTGDEPRFRHRNDQRINSAVAGSKKRTAGDAWMWDRRDGADICPLVAVTEALHGFTAYGQRELVPMVAFV